MSISISMVSWSCLSLFGHFERIHQGHLLVKGRTTSTPQWQLSEYEISSNEHPDSWQTK